MNNSNKYISSDTEKDSICVGNEKGVPLTKVFKKIDILYFISYVCSIVEYIYIYIYPVRCVIII